MHVKLFVVLEKAYAKLTQNWIADYRLSTGHPLSGIFFFVCKFHRGQPTGFRAAMLRTARAFAGPTQ